MYIRVRLTAFEQTAQLASHLHHLENITICQACARLTKIYTIVEGDSVAQETPVCYRCRIKVFVLVHICNTVQIVRI